MLKKEFDFFVKNQNDLVAKYNGKVLAIQGDSIIGVYDNISDAYTSIKNENKLGSTMIQRCIPGPEAYTATITTQNICNW